MERKGILCLLTSLYSPSLASRFFSQRDMSFAKQKKANAPVVQAVHMAMAVALDAAIKIEIPDAMNVQYRIV